MMSNTPNTEKLSSYIRYVIPALASEMMWEHTMIKQYMGVITRYCASVAQLVDDTELTDGELYALARTIHAPSRDTTTAAVSSLPAGFVESMQTIGRATGLTGDAASAMKLVVAEYSSRYREGAAVVGPHVCVCAAELSSAEQLIERIRATLQIPDGVATEVGVRLVRAKAVAALAKPTRASSVDRS